MTRLGGPHRAGEALGARTRRRWSRAGCAAAVALAAAAGATDGQAQSPLSLVNVGQNIAVTDARQEGRGGWALAESDTLVPGFHNLAGLAGLRGVTVLICGYGESIASAGGEDERTNRRVWTPTLRAALPLWGGRAALTAGFRSRRATQYSILTPNVWTSGTDTLASGERQVVREGTQWEVPLGVAIAVTERLAVGVGLNIVRGLTRERLTDFFYLPLDNDGMPLYRSASLVVEDKPAGEVPTFALQATPWSGLTLGGAFTPAHDVEVERTQEVIGVAGIADSTFTLRRPPEWGLGAAWRFQPRWRAGLDYERIALSQLRGRADWERDLVDEWTVAVGVQRERGAVRRAGLHNWPLRFGLKLRRWGYRVGGDEVRETRLAVGTGFAFRQGEGQFDVALSHGWIGDRERNGYEDRVWRLTVSIAGVEKWW